MDKTNKAYYYLVGILLVVIGGGMIFYRFVEDMSWVDAYYFCVITLTTVGYGDITPKTDLGKIFTTFYLLIGIGIITSFITITAKRRAKIMIKKHKLDK